MSPSIEFLSSKMASHLEAVVPGEPFSISEAAQPGDGVWQGDLGICLIDRRPRGYVAAKATANRNLLSMTYQGFVQAGQTIGSSHFLDSLEGAEVFCPENWSAESLIGPVLKLKKARTITHPKHGDVTIPGGRIVQITYQREWDAEQRRQRRNAD